MKPGRRAFGENVRITGDELRELKRHTGSMAEAFGLDSRSRRIKSLARSPLPRYLECLMDVIICELTNPRKYPDMTTPSIWH